MLSNESHNQDHVINTLFCFGSNKLYKWFCTQKVINTQFFVSPSLLESMDYFCGVLDEDRADRQTSQTTLTFFQKLAGDFVGYQIALDVGYFYPSLFNDGVLVSVGPGALAVLRRIFVLFKCIRIRNSRNIP